MRHKMIESSRPTTRTEQGNPAGAITVRCELEAAIGYAMGENVLKHIKTSSRDKSLERRSC